MKVHKTILMGTLAVALTSASLYIAAPQAKLSFEAATIKPNAANDNNVMMMNAPGGRLNMTGVNLRRLILNAYGVQAFQVTGGPSWIDSDRWDVQTTAGENATPAQVNQMLQTLLADRFQLKMHKESREASVYNLTVAKGGPKMEESKPADGDGGERGAPPAIIGGGANGGGRGGNVVAGRGQFMVSNNGAKTQISGGAMTMSQLAARLGNLVGRTVIDKTGLTGNYDVKLEWTPDIGQNPGFGGPPPAGAPADDALPSLYTSIQEQLGLKLDSTKGPVDVYVIDSVQKPVEPQQKH